jgi:hypothetical protein
MPPTEGPFPKSEELLSLAECPSFGDGEAVGTADWLVENAPPDLTY